MEARQISVPTFDDQTRTFEFECFSSLATDADVAPLQYTLSIGIDGSAVCSCPDFRNRGIASKHLRAALVQLAALCSQGICIPDFSLLTTYDEARTRFLARTPIVSMALAVQPNPPTHEDTAMVVDGDTAPSPSANPLSTLEGLPTFVFSTRRSAQMVDDVIQESRDIFADPGGRRFARGRGTAPMDAAGVSSDEDSEPDPGSSDEDQDGDENEPAALHANESTS